MLEGIGNGFYFLKGVAGFKKPELNPEQFVRGHRLFESSGFLLVHFGNLYGFIVEDNELVAANSPQIF